MIEGWKNFLKFLLQWGIMTFGLIIFLGTCFAAGFLITIPIGGIFMLLNINFSENVYIYGTFALGILSLLFLVPGVFRNPRVEDMFNL